MFEKEIKFIYDISLNHVKQLGSHFTFDELAASKLHPAIIRYISAEIDYLIYEDRQKLLSNSNFDYSGEEINRYFDLIGKEIKKTKKFSLDYIGNLTLHAISFTFNYLAQPNWSLIRLVFARDSVLPASEVLQVVEYVYYYSFVKDIIRKYIQRKNLLSVEKREIETMLTRVDQEIYSNPTERLIDPVLSSMGEFFNIGGVKKTNIPLLSFELFLKEKKLDEYWSRLESALGTDVKQTYEMGEIRRIIYSSPEGGVRKDSYLNRILKQENPLEIFKKTDRKATIEPISEKEAAADIPVISEKQSGGTIEEKEEMPKTEEKLHEKNTAGEQTPEGSLKDTPAEDSLVNFTEDDEEEIKTLHEFLGDDPEKGANDREESLFVDSSIDSGIDEAGEEIEFEIDPEELSFEESGLSEEDFRGLDEVLGTGDDIIIDLEMDDSAETDIDEIDFRGDDFTGHADEPADEPFEGEAAPGSKTQDKNDQDKNVSDEKPFDKDIPVIKETGKKESDKKSKVKKKLRFTLFKSEDEKTESAPPEEPNKDIKDLPAADKSLSDESVSDESVSDKPEADDLVTAPEESIEGKPSADEEPFIDDGPFLAEDSFLAEESFPDEEAETGLIINGQGQMDWGEIDVVSEDKLRRRDRGEITELFSKREMSKVVKSVFNEDREEFIGTFKTISMCNNISEADKIIKSLFVSNLVSPTSKEAKIIKKIVTKYFKQD